MNRSIDTPCLEKRENMKLNNPVPQDVRIKRSRRELYAGRYFHGNTFSKTDPNSDPEKLIL